MTSVKLIATTSLIAMLAACGGSNNSGDMLDDDDRTAGQQLDSNGVSTAPIDVTELETFANELGEGIDFDELPDFDMSTTASGSASYAGFVLIADVDVDDVLFEDEEEFVESEEIEASFALLGRSVLNVAFGPDPSISGGANAFVGINAESAEEFGEGLDTEALDEASNEDLIELLDDLPLVEVDGALTYSGGELIDEDGITTIGFDVAGSLTADGTLIGAEAGDMTAAITGEGQAMFSEEFGIGILELEGTIDGETAQLGGLVIGAPTTED